MVSYGGEQGVAVVQLLYSAAAMAGERESEKQRDGESRRRWLLRIERAGQGFIHAVSEGAMQQQWLGRSRRMGDTSVFH